MQSWVVRAVINRPLTPPGITVVCGQMWCAVLVTTFSVALWSAGRYGCSLQQLLDGSKQDYQPVWSYPLKNMLCYMGTCLAYNKNSGNASPLLLLCFHWLPTACFIHTVRAMWTHQWYQCMILWYWWTWNVFSFFSRATTLIISIILL